MWIHRIASGESAPIRNVPGQGSVWAPDGNSFVIYREGTLTRVDLAPGTHTAILREDIYTFAWGPSGSYLVGVAGKGLFWAGGGFPRKQLTAQKPDEGAHESARFLPGGRSFLFHKRRPDAVEIWFARFDGSPPNLLLTAASLIRYAPPGYLLYLRGDSLMAQRLDAVSGTLQGDPQIIVTGVGQSPKSRIGWFSVSENGVLAYRQGTVTNAGRLTWFDRTGSRLEEVGNVADYSNLALSPDGKRVAACIRDSTGQRDIWVFDLARGNKTRVTFDLVDDTNPAWSPDGSEIVYSSSRHGHRDIYARSSLGTGPGRPILESSADKTVLDWSRDGQSLVYSVPNPKIGRVLWMLHATGGDPKPSLFHDTPLAEDYALFSPDSQWLLYRTRENGGAALNVERWPTNGQKWQISRSSDSAVGEAMWRADGKEIFYLSGKTIMSVPVSATASGIKPSAPQKLFSLPFDSAMGRNRFVVSPDGQRFLVILPERAQDEALTPFVVIVNWPRLLEHP